MPRNLATDNLGTYITKYKLDGVKSQMPEIFPKLLSFLTKQEQEKKNKKKTTKKREDTQTEYGFISFITKFRGGHT
jgi:hypothetical protein